MILGVGSVGGAVDDAVAAGEGKERDAASRSLLAEPIAKCVVRADGAPVRTATPSEGVREDAARPARARESGAGAVGTRRARHSKKGRHGGE